MKIDANLPANLQSREILKIQESSVAGGTKARSRAHPLLLNSSGSGSKLSKNDSDRRRSSISDRNNISRSAYTISAGTINVYKYTNKLEFIISMCI